MAFPVSILLPNGTVLTLAGALSRTITPKWLYGPSGRRDIITAGKLGNAYQPVVKVNAAQTQGALIDHILIADPDSNNADILAGINGLLAGRFTNSGGVTSDVNNLGDGGVAGPITPLALDGEVTMKAPADVKCALFEEDDDYTHTGSRPDPVLRTLIEYWDHATEPGIAQTLTGIAVNGSYEVTFGSHQTLTIGQKLTANTSFASGAIIVGLKHIVELPDGTTESSRCGTVAIMSVKAGAGATTEAFVFPGSNLVAWHTPEGDIAAGVSFALLS